MNAVIPMLEFREQIRVVFDAMVKIASLVDREG